MLGARIRRVVESLTELRMRIIEGELVAWSNLVDPFKYNQSTPMYGHLVSLPPEDTMNILVEDKESDENARNEISARMHTYFMKLRVQHPFTHDVTSLCAWWRLDDAHSPAYEDFRRTAAGEKADEGQKAIELSQDFLSRTKTVGMGVTSSDNSSISGGSSDSVESSQSTFVDGDLGGKGSYNRALALLIEDAKMATLYSAAQERLMKANPGLVRKEVEQYNAAKFLRQRALIQRKEAAERAANVQNLRESVSRHQECPSSETHLNSVTKLNAAIATDVLSSSFYGTSNMVLVEEPFKNETKILKILDKSREKEEKARESKGVVLEAPGVEACYFVNHESNSLDAVRSNVEDYHETDEDQETEDLPFDFNAINGILSSNQLDITSTPMETQVTDTSNHSSKITGIDKYVLSSITDGPISNNLNNNSQRIRSGVTDLTGDFVGDHPSFPTVTELEEEYEDTSHIVDVNEENDLEDDESFEDHNGGTSF